MSRALKPGGRLVCEFGGHGNIRILVEAAYRALRQLGVEHPERFNPWYYPSIAEYAAILERCGLEVTFAHLFDRPTPLQDGERGLDTWFRMFGSRLMEPLAARPTSRISSASSPTTPPLTSSATATGPPTTAACASPHANCREPKRPAQRNN